MVLCTHKDGALVGRMAAALSVGGTSSFATGEWLTLFTLALPGHLNIEMLPFPRAKHWQSRPF